MGDWGKKSYASKEVRRFGCAIFIFTFLSEKVCLPLAEPLGQLFHGEVQDHQDVLCVHLIHSGDLGSTLVHCPDDVLAVVQYVGQRDGELVEQLLVVHGGQHLLDPLGDRDEEHALAADRLVAAAVAALRKGTSPMIITCNFFVFGKNKTKNIYILPAFFGLLSAKVSHVKPHLEFCSCILFLNGNFKSRLISCRYFTIKQVGIGICYTKNNKVTFTKS